MYEGIIQDLIDELGKLPGIGPKSAQRIAFHIIQSENIDVTKLAEILRDVKSKVKFCQECGNISEDQKCQICSDPRRDSKFIWNKFVDWVRTAIDVRAATIAMRSRKIQEAKEIMMK